MFPGQQGATWPSQLWPPRLGIKLLEGAPSTENWAQGVYFRVTSQKIGDISLDFAHWVQRAKSGHINPATPVTLCTTLFRYQRIWVRVLPPSLIAGETRRAFLDLPFRIASSESSSELEAELVAMRSAAARAPPSGRGKRGCKVEAPERGCTAEAANQKQDVRTRNIRADRTAPPHSRS